MLAWDKRKDKVSRIISFVALILKSFLSYIKTLSKHFINKYMWNINSKEDYFYRLLTQIELLDDPLMKATYGTNISINEYISIIW